MYTCKVRWFKYKTSMIAPGLASARCLNAVSLMSEAPDDPKNGYLQQYVGCFPVIYFSLVLIFMLPGDEVEIWDQRVGTLVFRIELNYLPQREAQGSNPTPVLGKSNPQFSLCFGSSQVLPAQWRHWPALREGSESPPTPRRAGPKLRNREQRARSLRCTRTVAGSAGPQLPACPAGCTESSWLGALALLPHRPIQCRRET